LHNPALEAVVRGAPRAQPAPRAALSIPASRPVTHATNRWLRRAAELVERLNKGKQVRNTIKHYEEIQIVLGELRDGVIARNTMLALAAKAGTTPGDLW
jgi:hypothetical protein